MDELFGFLFAAAVQFSGLPAIDGWPPVQAMPYEEMLQEICADLEDDLPRLEAQHEGCIHSHRMLPAACDGLEHEARKYERCTGQKGLMAAYIIEQRRIVYRDELDLGNDADNSFVVHEFVHALQQHHYGDRMFETCQGIMAMERQAYAAQQAYLKSRGQLLRVGERLRFVGCGDLL